MALVIVSLLLLSVTAQICPNQGRECDRPNECCSKWGFCGTGEAWCKETWDFGNCPECICDGEEEDTQPSGQPTPEPTQPFEENCNCICYGDPHCKMWNCELNHWQGPHFVDPIDVYYMTRCNGYDTEDMPFDLIGVNQRYDNYFTSLNFTILKLYGVDGVEMCIKHKGSEGVSYNDDCGDDYDMTPSQNEVVTVADMFEIQWRFENGYSKLYVTVTDEERGCVDENSDYDLEIITMTAAENEESVQISVSECYKNFTCGMCGDFFNYGRNFQTSDGSTIELDTGAWGGTANDETGLTWSVAIDHTTETPQRRLLETETGEPCNGLREEIEYQCHLQMRQYADCCWDRRGFCDDVEIACGWDSCACVTGKAQNETQAGFESIAQTCILARLNASMSFICGLPAKVFDIPDMSKYDTSANKETATQCTDSGSATGWIVVGGVFIGFLIFGLIAAGYFFVIKPKSQQEKMEGTGGMDAEYSKM